MLYIVWNEVNHLGIPILDEQHRGIVSTINSLHYFIQKGMGEQIVKPTLELLQLYSKIHFQTEEALMAKANYSAREKHSLLHRHLINQTAVLVREATSNLEPEAVLKFLKEWWLNHINIEDRKYASALQQYSGGT